MATRRKKQPIPLWLAVILIVLAAVGYFMKPGSPVTKPADGPSPLATPNGNMAQIYYLDIGQGDSELICLSSGETILIDAGTGETSEELVQYIKKLGIQKIDLLLATHPHEDHIGGMSEVIKQFEIGKIYLPKVAENKTPTTRVYEKLLETIQSKGLKITQAKPGTTIFETDAARLEILAPNGEKYEDLNNYSIVTKLTYGEKSFLFTGDAEIESEKEMIQQGYNLKSDVLKCGHHGSSSSTSAQFLKAVAPKYAVLSCGVKNDYGHPHKEVLTRLQMAGITIYRTDEQDTVLAQCDGKQITFSTNIESVIK